MGHSGLLLYLQYLRHLRSKDEVKRLIDTEEAKMETGYLDHLQSALHPLGDNLEFATYEVVSRTSEASERLTEERSDDGRSLSIRLTEEIFQVSRRSTLKS